MTTPSFDSIEAQASYGIGLQIGQQLTESGLQGLIPDALLAGITDVLQARPAALAMDTLHQALREMYQRADTRRRQRQRQQATQNEAWLQANQRREGVRVTESGLQFRVLRQGDGPIPSRQDRVRVHYSGKRIDGTVFDSSRQRGEAAEFPLNDVIPGWIEALTLMPTGSHWELTIPHQLAYGEHGAGADIPPFSTLIFDVELLKII